MSTTNGSFRILSDAELKIKKIKREKELCFRRDEKFWHRCKKKELQVLVYQELNTLVEEFQDVDTVSDEVEKERNDGFAMLHLNFFMELASPKTKTLKVDTDSGLQVTSTGDCCNTTCFSCLNFEWLLVVTWTRL